MPDGLYNPSITQAQLDAAAAQNLAIMAAQIPQPSGSAPPPVALMSVEGASAAFARADHTHQSSVQRQRVSVPLTANKATVPFVLTYAAAPVVVASAETPLSVTDGVYVASVVAGSVTATGFDVQVYKVAKSVTLPGLATSLLGFVVNVLGTITGNVTVDYIAAPATV